ncbi:hypothetical protein GIB67_032009 [Kingdonia uniflora]|uniref:Uncharacterized protein n=1 Tax=Kingdonia uniflora TaxID=39325 RepID=A0A7J7MX12_9MAGN|nr:hypothetical protein GIB67_032009 [Kingdonia uniflora]
MMQVGVEGLQVLKPQNRKNVLHSTFRGTKNTSQNSGGINLEVCMVLSEDNVNFEDNENMEMHDWVVENLKFSVKEPIEAVATKEELQHLAVLCRSEIDSMGRIAAGILRVLKLETSIGQAAIDQLSNLGSESLDKIFTPEKLSRHSSTDNVKPVLSSNMINGSSHQSIESTVASLEFAILCSQAKCSDLVTELSNPNISVRAQHLTDIKQLSQRLDSMKILLTQLQTQI